MERKKKKKKTRPLKKRSFKIKNIGKGCVCVCVYLCGWTDGGTREENNFIVPDTPDTTTLCFY
jgi:hypothetical protein